MAQMSVMDVPAQHVAVVRRTVEMSELPTFFAEAFGAVAAAVARAGGVVVGAPFGWYHGIPAETVDVAAGFPVSEIDVGALEGDVEVVERPGSLAATAMHLGSFETLADTYRELEAWLRERQLDQAAHNWEEYLSDPEAQPDPGTWETRIVWPLQ